MAQSSNGPITKERLIQLGKEYLWPTFGKDASFFDREFSIVSSAEGSYVYDMDGKRYLDTVPCLAAAILGYNHPRVLKAMTEQMKKLCGNVSGTPATIPAILLAEKIAKYSPEGLTRTFFTLTGSDAVETSIRIARQYFRILGKGTKQKVITKWDEYHGASLLASTLSGYPLRRKDWEPLAPGILHVHAPYCYRCPHKMTYPQCGIYCAYEIERVIEHEDPSNIACILSELTIGTGIIPPPPEYPKIMRQICDKYDILLIIDEVVIGMGRSGRWFGSQYFDIVPDMIVLSKGLHGGHLPSAAVHVKKTIADAFSGDKKNMLQHGFTMGGYPLGCAVGLAIMEELEESTLMSEVEKKGAFLTSELLKLKEQSPIIGDVRNTGLEVGVEFVRNMKTKEMFQDRYALANLVAEVGREDGVILTVLPHMGILVINPALIISYDELGLVARAIGKAVKRIEREFRSLIIVS